MFAVRQIFHHLRYGWRTKRQSQALIGRAKIDDERNLRAFDVLEKNQRKFVFPFELLDDAAGFLLRIDFFVYNNHIFGPFFEQLV